MIKFPKIIAHAGGIINDIPFSNSLEALEESYENRKLKFIEIDVISTKDDQLVLIHDWQIMREVFFQKQGIASFEEFQNDKMQVKESPNAKGAFVQYLLGSGLKEEQIAQIKPNFQQKLTPVTFEDSLNWLAKHQDVHFLIDSKSGLEPIEVFNYVELRHPNLLPNIIFSIYDAKQYSDFPKNFQNQLVFHTGADEQKDDQYVLSFIQKNKVAAVVVGRERINPEFIKQINDLEIEIILYTVNNLDLLKYYQNLGIKSFVSDFL